MQKNFVSLNFLNSLNFLGFLLFAVGCATGTQPVVLSPVSPMSGETSSSVLTPSAGNPGAFIVKGVVLQNTQFDLGIVNNEHVEKWVDYFTGKGREYFTLYLERAQYFIPFIIPILKEEGVPLDLVYVALIESGFNVRARSRAKAVGAWQFIAPTGRRYGLKVDWWVDERRNIAKSTRAAVAYLKDLYQQFGSWELALSAYNAGEYKIARAVSRYGTDNFWTLIRHRFLRPETRNYVPKMMAAAILAKNRTQFGFPAGQVDFHLLGDETLASDGSIVETTEQDQEVVDNTTPGQKVPNDDEEVEELLEQYGKDYPNNSLPAVCIEDPKISEADIPHLALSGEVGGSRLATIELKGPADILQVAKASGLSYEMVKRLNPELNRWVTPPYMDKYTVYLPMTAKTKFLINYNHPAFPREVAFRKYEVRSGDNFRRIARRFGISEEGIADLNGMRISSPISPGRKILLPMPEDRSRSLASLELKDPPSRRRVRAKPRRGRHVRVSFQQQNGQPAAATRGSSVNGGI